MKALTFKPPVAVSGKPALQIVDLPIPQPQEGEILVRVHYAGLNYFDFEAWGGHRNKAITKALQKGVVISGIEMSGIAESDGERIRRGDKVVGYTNIFKGPWFHAEYVVLSERKLAKVPENISLDGAASIVGGALTAIAALERIAGLKRGDSVLITGATGSVGVTAVQLASHLGADVSAVCHSTQLDFVRSEGASEAYAYDKRELPKSDKQFDLVFDAAPSLSFSKALKYLKPQGQYITTMPHLDVPGFLTSLFSRRKWGYLMETDTGATRMERLRELMSQNAFRPAIDSVHPLATAADAFDRQQETGKRGKILLNCT